MNQVEFSYAIKKASASFIAQYLDVSADTAMRWLTGESAPPQELRQMIVSVLEARG
jgi:hypothetical protein